MMKMGEAYGPYPMLDAFAQDMTSPQRSEDSQPSLSAQSSAKGVKLRRHAACDECRKRKLKCTGEPTGCSRCVKNGIPCIYSQQKQMGRPRKRQKLDEEPQSPVEDNIEYAYPPPSAIPVTQTETQDDPPLDTPIDPSLANIDQDLTNFQNVCTAPYAQTIRSQREANAFEKSLHTNNSNLFEQDGNTPRVDFSYSQYPTDISQWPDFSTVDKLPLPLTTKYGHNPANDVYFTTPSAASITSGDTTQQLFDPDVDPSALSALPTIPACPCLPNLYLTLSTLSTLPAFPTSQHTIDTLLSAHKTAHSVIYCPVCPQQFMSGSQNLMLGCALLNVIADMWHRVRKTSPDNLRKGFGKRQSVDSISAPNTPQFVSTREGQAWRAFVHQLIRAYVFGDASIPTPPSSSSTSVSSSPNPSTPTQSDGQRVPEDYTLVFLIDALSRRQRQWHRVDSPTDEFPDRHPCEYPIQPTPHHGYGTSLSSTCPKSNGQEAHKTSESNESGSSVEVNGHEANSTKSSDVTGHQHDHNHNHNHDHDHVDPSHQRPESFLCLMIVKHSMDIVKALEAENWNT